MLFSWRYVWPHRVWVPFFLEPILSLKLCLTRKSMSSFILFWSSYCFLALILFLAQCLTRKSMSSFFVGTLFGTLFGPKSMSSFFWNYFFWEPVFLAQCLARKSTSFFSELFFAAFILFWHTVGPKKYEFLFFRTHFFLSPYFFGAMFLSSFFFGAHTFLRRCLAWKSMSCPFPELFGFFWSCDVFDEQNVWIS